MKNPREIIIAPIFSEKTSLAKELKNAYTFEVSMNANKIEIKRAIEKIFNVDVESVNTIRYNGKPKRLGRFSGYKSDWKKAIVTVKAGQAIADFEI
ncbi:MAG: 50S ribosomal protein L23 [Candidatus Cloacimonetes bacterium]|jgi:large subunit ribosomal protein L23|nr:50S ribosomal protein L23 [Candidatus Cloacimonadota bacterium]MDD4157357.1 50S ribosomal protein L23 [Candidatus Cloacimonadota bacterium]